MCVPVMDEISNHAERWRAEFFVKASFWAFESIGKIPPIVGRFTI